MSKFRNVTNGFVTIPDLGLTMAPGEEFFLDKHQEKFSKNLRDYVSKGFVTKTIQRWLGIPSIVNDVRETIIQTYKETGPKRELKDITEQVQEIKLEILQVTEILGEIKQALRGICVTFSDVEGNRLIEEPSDLVNFPLFIPSIEGMEGEVQVAGEPIKDNNLKSSVEKLKNLRKDQGDT